MTCLPSSVGRWSKTETAKVPGFDSAHSSCALNCAAQSRRGDGLRDGHCS